MILVPEDKLTTPEDFDKLVCAEIPDENLQPKLFETVKSYMVHEPCGDLNLQAPCMVDGKCSKCYYCEFAATTTTNKHGYPLYRKRDDGHVIIKGNNVLDNPYLCQNMIATSM